MVKTDLTFEGKDLKVFGEFWNFLFCETIQILSSVISKK